MKHLRIAGKRVQTMELYLYLLSAVVTAMAFVVAVYVRQALTPLLFSAGYEPTIANGALIVVGAMIPKMLMRVYEQKTAASRAMHLQLHVTAATLFFFGMILLFYFQPGTRIPISIVLIFIAVDLIAAVILMPAHYFLAKAAAQQRTIAVMADDATFESLSNHRLAQTTHQATFTRLTREELPASLTETEGEGAKAPFEQLVLDRASSAHVPDWTLLLAARDAGVVIQTPEAFLESEFGEALTDESAAYDIIMASSSNWNQLRIAVKRAFDWFVASALLLTTLPLSLLTGLAIWLEDRGPVFYQQRRVGLNGLGQPLVDGFELFFQCFQRLLDEFDNFRIGGLLPPVVLLVDQIEQLSAALGQCLELEFLRRLGLLCGGLHDASIEGNHLGINRVGLGVLANAVGEGPHATSVDDGHGDLVLMQQPDQDILIAPPWLPSRRWCVVCL